MWWVGVLLGVAVACADVGIATATESPAIARLLAMPSPLLVDGDALDVAALRDVYAARGYAPVWTDPTRATAVVAVLAAAADDGLDPEAYHAAALVWRMASPSTVAAPETDVLLTDATARYVRDVIGGVAPPAAPSSEMALPPARIVDARPLVVAVANASDPADAMRALAPTHPSYRSLRVALAEYRALDAQGGWPGVPDGPSVHVGEADPAVPLIRQRLQVTGELAPASLDPSPVYDASLEAAVRAFQRRHGLSDDGVVGRATRAAMAVGAAERVQQIRANMDRWRWMPPETAARHVRINIPAYSLELREGQQAVLAMPVVVGSTKRPTPMFASRITYLVFNPAWTVPVKLAREDLLPKMRRNQGYGSAHGIRVYTSWESGADEVHPDDIDWHAVGPAIASLKLRQEPGPGNPLGRVKFSMPNGFDVYLHDTNQKGLLRQSRRAFSSGCVRLGDALALADALLSDQPGWSAARRAEVLDGWRTKAVTLAKPVPVMLAYETAWRDAAGVVHFREDVYGRDQRQVRAMAAASRRGRGAPSV